jgi:hypothetical protein
MRITNPRWAELFAAFCLVVVFFSNHLTFSKMRVFRNWDVFLATFGLEQNWGMFKDAYKYDGWYVMPGRTNYGDDVDVFSGKAVDWEKPKERKMYKNDRRRKYLTVLPSTAGKAILPYYARYICRSWNESHPYYERLEKFKIYRMVEPTMPEGQASTVKKTLVLDFSCWEQEQQKK